PSVFCHADGSNHQPLRSSPSRARNETSSWIGPTDSAAGTSGWRSSLVTPSATRYEIPPYTRSPSTTAPRAAKGANRRTFLTRPRLARLSPNGPPGLRVRADEPTRPPISIPLRRAARLPSAGRLVFRRDGP